MTTRRGFLGLLGGGAAVAVMAAGGYALLPGSSTATGDPTIKYGKEECAHCGMVISEDRFAAASRSSGKDTHYDDIGCMVLYLRENAPAAGATFFVRAFEEDAWLDAATATYAAMPGIKSPMSYDIAAFATAESAAAASNTRSGARVMSWDQLRQDLQTRD
ncbi:MAG: nitrous oxide reductase accessory protein NosL [Dehalococcoidia bacterium]|nr:nitrous oxide reductase accessory protein NosL [Dehalococcoidia bacterium]